MSPCQYTNRGKLQSSITFTTIVFLHIVPQYLLITKDNPPLLQTFILTFNITTFFVYLYLLLTMVNKGYVKDENSNASLLKRIVQFKKYCYRCKTYRPERSHHCSKCNKCIKKMDHHCFWINTCVNNDNLGHFVRFLFFACIATFELVLYMTYRIVGDMRVGYFVDHRFMLCFEVFVVLYAILVCVILALFVVAQMRYILKNITFLEKEAVSNLIKYAVPPEHNPYDRGKWNNFVDVFGSPKGLFLFKGKGDGFTFKKTYDVEQWPPARGSKRMSEYSSKRVVDMEEV